MPNRAWNAASPAGGSPNAGGANGCGGGDRGCGDLVIAPGDAARAKPTRAGARVRLSIIISVGSQQIGSDL